MIKFLIILLNFLDITFSFDGEMSLKELGEREYLVLKDKSNLPMHGACWHNVLKNLKNSCDQLNDHEHSLLALGLSNCFLQDSGHITYDCHLSESESERKKCINGMSDRAFGVYNEFYTHTTHICFYLNHELWQIETKKTIKTLYEASSKMTAQLVEAAEMQNSMLESQKIGLKIQNQLLDDGKQLGTVIKSSADAVNTMVSDFKEASKEQQVLLYEIFMYMKAFQDWIIGEVSWFQSILYYTATCIIFALFSCSKRTADARISLFTILSINVIIERMLIQYSNNCKGDCESPDNNIQAIYLTWWLRKFSLLLCFGILLYSYFSYKDQHLENHHLLKRIEKQLHSMEDNMPLRYSTRLAVKRLKTSKFEHQRTKTIS